MGQVTKEMPSGETDKEPKLYGLIPLMASCSYGQIGALNAESFC